MSSLDLWGRCLVELILCMIICSVGLWMNFIDQYNSIERKKMMHHVSFPRKISLTFLKPILLESKSSAIISYVLLRLSQILFLAECIGYLCWSRSIQIWSILENISVGYLILIVFANTLLILSGPSAADTTERDGKLEYITAKNELEQLKTDRHTSANELKQSALHAQNMAYQYYRWLYEQRGKEYSSQIESEIQYLIQCFQTIDETHFFLTKSMFFVPTDVYLLEFENAVATNSLDEALHILSSFIQKIGKVHDWNAEIGRNDLLTLHKNCKIWFDLADKMECLIKEDKIFDKKLFSVYDDACTSLMTAPKSLRQEAKRRKQNAKH